MTRPLPEAILILAFVAVAIAALFVVLLWTHDDDRLTPPETAEDGYRDPYLHRLADEVDRDRGRAP